jgi:erythrin-vacuolar iron transport family protein
MKASGRADPRSPLPYPLWRTLTLGLPSPSALPTVLGEPNYRPLSMVGCMATTEQVGTPQGAGLISRLIQRAGFDSEREFVLRVVQPGLVGLIDGTVSSLAPIFAAAVSANSHTAFVVGLSVALGAGVSMGMSEALSDTGASTGRGSPLVRGLITGLMTAFGSIFHTLPFLISEVQEALTVAGIVVGVELFLIAWLRNRFLDVSLRSSLLVVTLGGAIALAIGIGIGSI